VKNYYDSPRAASEYLLFHYGDPQLRPPAGWSDSAALPFPARCVQQCLDTARLPGKARALDLGCAVGRASFELARYCAEVVGIDFSRRFIALANRLRRDGEVKYRTFEEGRLTRERRAAVPRGIDRQRVRFEAGDATDLRRDLGQFEAVLMLNLIDRLAAPAECLERVAGLVRPGGQLIIASPYTWLADYTPRRRWLGGFVRRGRPVGTLDTFRRLLVAHFDLAARLDVPWLLREHARKYQLGVSEATVWIRREQKPAKGI
jgi:putative 4-mercaptohistidine N1-methyltranferase